MKLINLLLLIILSYNVAARAEPLISGLSQNEIKIDARFSGTKLFLFGVRNLTGDIVVVIRGPKQDYIVRKKENILGMWLNRKQMTFKDIYGYYAVYSSIDMADIADLILLNLNIGLKNIPFNYQGKAYIEEIDSFKNAVLNDKFEYNLFSEEFGKIDFMGDALFQISLDFPKNIPQGLYNAEIYLVNGANLVGIQSIPISVEKTGFEAMIHDFAYEHNLLYGLLCVFAALFAGWVASMVFWKV